MNFGTFLEESNVVSITARKDERDALRRRRKEWEERVATLIEPLYDSIADAVTEIRELNADYLDVSQGENPSEVVYQHLKQLVDNFPY